MVKFSSNLEFYWFLEFGLELRSSFDESRIASIFENFTIFRLVVADSGAVLQ